VLGFVEGNHENFDRLLALCDRRDPGVGNSSESPSVLPKPGVANFP
jgi:hypothetical protein